MLLTKVHPHLSGCLCEMKNTQVEYYSFCKDDPTWVDHNSTKIPQISDTRGATNTRNVVGFTTQQLSTKWPEWHGRVSFWSLKDLVSSSEHPSA